MSGSIDRRRFLAAAAALPLAAARDPGALAGSLRAGGAGPRPGPDENGLPPHTIGLQTSGGNFRFDPVGLRVEPGTNLLWLNMGDFHTTTAFHPDNAGLVGGELPLRIPEAAEPWHSGMLGLTAGTQFETLLEVEGVYDYFCQPHYGFGMVGRVVVGAPADGPGSRPLDGLPDAVRGKMPALERIMGDAGRSFEWAARLNGVLYLLANDRPAGEPARAAARGIRDDEALARHLGSDAAARVAEKAAAFASSVEAGDGYESLAAEANGIKSLLRT